MRKTRRVKKNIKEDQLVTTAVRVSGWAQAHFNQVIIGVVVLVALIAVLVFTANSRQSAARQGDRQLGQALNLYQNGDYESAKTTFAQVRNRIGGRSGVIAQYYKAECEVKQRNFQVALVEYDAYLKDASDFPEFKEAAVYARAMCQEGLGLYREAAQTLVGLMEDLDPEDPRYLDSAFQAGEFFAQAGDMEKAADHFQLVADEATGGLKDRASVAAALLGR